ncbi:hypothetical protein QE152_g9307 [Popillia japonica]|uniref:Uncharacterized protein n=1 Tax=Popillia japonica TaxID=7064 RepID=A0AAW1M034_POPJA
MLSVGACLKFRSLKRIDSMIESAVTQFNLKDRNDKLCEEVKNAECYKNKLENQEGIVKGLRATINALTQESKIDNKTVMTVSTQTERNLTTHHERVFNKDQQENRQLPSKTVHSQTKLKTQVNYHDNCKNKPRILIISDSQGRNITNVKKNLNIKNTYSILTLCKLNVGLEYVIQDLHLISVLTTM